MNPETFIPFTVGDYPTCSEPGRQYVVSLRILNAITQTVAIPRVLRGAAAGQRIDKLKLSCASYVAHWDGAYEGTGRKAASGVYPYILEVDGQKSQRKMTVAK
jgi:hypothetical protein